MWHMGAPILIVVCKIFSCSMLTLSWGLWVLVPPPGIEPKLPALEAWTLSQWTTEEVPQTCSLEAINTHLLSHSSVKSEVQVQRGLSSCYLRFLQASQGVGRAAFCSREPEKESALSYYWWVIGSNQFLTAVEMSSVSFLEVNWKFFKASNGWSASLFPSLASTFTSFLLFFPLLFFRACGTTLTFPT